MLRSRNLKYTGTPELSRRSTQGITLTMGQLIPEVSPIGLRITMWVLLPLWMLWVGMSLIHDDRLAAAATMENGLFQNLTVCGYGLAALLLVLAAIPLVHRDSTSRLRPWWLLSLAVGCVVVAGEEVNWGQTFLHYSTPNWLEGANIQQEFSLHNLRLPGSLSGKHWANELLWWLAVLGGIILPLALMYSERFRRLAWIMELPIPPRLTQMYCLAGVVIPRDGLLIGRLSRDNIASELREVTIAVAIAVWAWSLWQRQDRSRLPDHP